MKFSSQLFIGIIGVGLILTGCKSFEDYQEDRLAKAVAHFEKAQYSNIPEGKVLTLNECFAMARANNLDLKVFGLEEQVSKEMRTYEILGMLPELNVSDNFNSRNNTPASRSEQLSGYGPGTYSYSQSQDRTVNYLNIDLALSVVDFGLAFFNTCQANDRMLLRQQHTRRAEQNLVLETVRVYCQVAASQRAIKVTKKLLEDCKDRYQLIEKMGETGNAFLRRGLFSQPDHKGLQNALWRDPDHLPVQFSDSAHPRCADRFDCRRQHCHYQNQLQIHPLHACAQRPDRFRFPGGICHCD
jgi:hypothetical protein